MTMIVGIHLGEYIIVAADKREVTMFNNIVVDINSDNVEKLIEWNGGIITGNGYVPLLNELKDHIAANEISDTSIILDYANTTVANLPLNQAGWKKQTNWMFSYITQLDNRLVTRLSFVTSSEINGTHMLMPMSSTIWAKLPDLNERIKELNNQLKPLKSWNEFHSNLSYHVSKLEILFKYASTVDQTISRDFSYFVQSHHGFRKLFN